MADRYRFINTTRWA